jgi:hypothetical protein
MEACKAWIEGARGYDPRAMQLSSCREKIMRIIIAAAAILIAAAWSDGANNSAAADPYRWCAQDIGQSGSTNCYFVTLEQCKAAASGAGSFCAPNTFYTGSDSMAAPRGRAGRRG